MRLRYWVLLLALLVAHFAGYSPIGAALDLCSHCWLAWRSSRVPALADNSFSAALRNVTGDFDQVHQHGSCLLPNPLTGLLAQRDRTGTGQYGA